MKQNNTYKYQKDRGIERKLHLIKIKGGCCELCGYTKNVAALDFHHKDPSMKSFRLDIRHLSNRSMKDILEEASKCSLLCANCHREVHNPDLIMDRVLGLVFTKDSTKPKLKSKNKPKCIDCQKEINYTYVRCNKCSCIHLRQKPRPDTDTLKSILKELGYKNTALKFDVSTTTIRRWVNTK